MGEGAAALAGAFAEIEDVRIAPHLLGDAVAHRVEPAGGHGRRRLPAAASASGGLSGSAIDVVANRRRIGLGRLRARSPAPPGRPSLDPRSSIASSSAPRRDGVFVDQPLAEDRRSDRASPRRRPRPACGRCRRPDRLRDGRRCGRSWPRSASGRRRAAPAATASRHRLVDGEHVVAVDGDAGNAVGGGLRGDRRC